MSRESEQQQAVSQIMLWAADPLHNGISDKDADRFIRQGYNPYAVWMATRNISIPEMAERLQLQRAQEEDKVPGLTVMTGEDLLRAYLTGVQKPDMKTIVNFCEQLSILPDRLFPDNATQPAPFALIEAAVFVAKQMIVNGVAAPSISQFLSRESNKAVKLAAVKIMDGLMCDTPWLDIRENAWFSFEDEIIKTPGEHYDDILDMVASYRQQKKRELNALFADVEKYDKWRNDYYLCASVIGGIGKRDAFIAAYADYVTKAGKDRAADALREDPRLIFPGSSFRSYTSTTMTGGGKISGHAIIEGFIEGYDKSGWGPDLVKARNALKGPIAGFERLKAWTTIPQARQYLMAVANSTYIDEQYVIEDLDVVADRWMEATTAKPPAIVPVKPRRS